MLPGRCLRRRRVPRSSARHNSGEATRARQTAPRSSPNRTAPRWLGLVALGPCSANLLDPAQLIEPFRLLDRKRTSFLTVYDTRRHTFLDEKWGDFAPGRRFLACEARAG